MRRDLLVSILASASLASVVMAADSKSARAESENPITAAPLGSAITYQGRLEKNGSPVSGNCNLTFKLYDALTVGTQIGSTLTLSNQQVTAGLFVGSLDFGPGAFNGQARWLEIQVQGPGDPGFTLLTPRQSVSPAPYALYSLNSTGSPWVVGSDGADLTYSGGGVGITGASSPLSGKGVFLERIGSLGYMFGFDYNTFTPIDLALQAPGGKVGIGTTAPVGRLHAVSNSETALIGVNTGNWVGIYGEAVNQSGVWGKSFNAVGVYGESQSINGYGGVFRNNAGGTALYADGKALVKSLVILGGADIVEGFETGDEALEPGTVVVIDADRPGELRPSFRSYDSRVAGVVSGAGGIAPGLKLGQAEVMDGQTSVAMAGRVYVRCTAQNGPIRPGDLLTTSNETGRAMRASESKRSLGSILGKAMTALDADSGLVLVLVNLQ